MLKKNNLILKSILASLLMIVFILALFQTNKRSIEDISELDPQHKDPITSCSSVIPRTGTCTPPILPPSSSSTWSVPPPCSSPILIPSSSTACWSVPPLWPNSGMLSWNLNSLTSSFINSGFDLLFTSGYAPRGL